MKHLEVWIRRLYTYDGLPCQPPPLRTWSHHSILDISKPCCFSHNGLSESSALDRDYERLHPPGRAKSWHIPCAPQLTSSPSPPRTSFRSPKELDLRCKPCTPHSVVPGSVVRMVCGLSGELHFKRWGVLSANHDPSLTALRAHCSPAPHQTSQNHNILMARP
jgi:hypothetical protein